MLISFTDPQVEIYYLFNHSVRAMLMRSAVLTVALLISCLSHAQALSQAPLQREIGRQIAQQTIALVEKEGLPPRNKEEYEAHKRNVLQLVDEDGETVDREQLYLRLQLMLNTLDSDGHTFLFSARQTAAFTGSTMPKAASSPELLRLIETPAGKVLHFTPPQITGSDKERTREYVSNGLRNMQSSGLPGQACALVIDLSGQKGGNAWPPVDLLRPLFKDSNGGRFVSRDNHRFPIFTLSMLDTRYADFGGGVSNPLRRFAGQPFAFVMNGNTSSAGEMLAVALLGEGERVRSFGWPSHGLTTANRTISLPDDAMLLLSGARYAIGDEAVIRGKLQPQVAAKEGESMETVLMAAATWAAAQSSLCKAMVSPSKGAE